jgi:hypothetical protein
MNLANRRYIKITHIVFPIQTVDFILLIPSASTLNDFSHPKVGANTFFETAVQIPFLYSSTSLFIA